MTFVEDLLATPMATPMARPPAGGPQAGRSPMAVKTLITPIYHK
jgi:hypothetical protein